MLCVLGAVERRRRRRDLDRVRFLGRKWRGGRSGVSVVGGRAFGPGVFGFEVCVTLELVVVLLGGTRVEAI